MPIRLYDCGHDVFVGDASACDAGGFDRIVHVYRGRNITGGIACRRVLASASTGPGLAVRCREEESPDPNSTAAIVAYARVPGRLLVHCVSGHCRSPQLAVAALVARGVEPFAGVGDVARAVYRGCGLFPAFRWETMTSILKACERA